MTAVPPQKTSDCMAMGLGTDCLRACKENNAVHVMFCKDAATVVDT